MSYQGVIFDLDGVLCHTDEIHFDAWRETALRVGVPFDREINERMKGLSRMDSLELLLGRWSGDFSAEEKTRLADEKNRRYLELLEAKGKALLDRDGPGVLQAVRAMGYRTAIGSSSKNARRILEILEIGALFDVLVDGTELTRGKPDPEVFLLAAQRLGLAPKDCLVVEDAQSGIEAAKAAGMDAALLTAGKSEFGEDFRLTTLPELLELLRGKPRDEAGE